MNTKYTIPGWMSDNECDLITNLISTLPHNSKILEVGTAFGKSTYSILDGMKNTQVLDVCDLWDDNHWKNILIDSDYARDTLMGNGSLVNYFVDMAKNNGIKNTWKNIVDEHPNSFLIRNVYNQSSLSLENTEYDLVFLDGNHSYQNVLQELEKFSNVPIICGDDFGYHVGDGVIKAVIEFGKKYNKILEVNLSSFFYILRNKN